FAVASLHADLDWQRLAAFLCVDGHLQGELDRNLAFVNGEGLLSKLKVLLYCRGVNGLADREALQITRLQLSRDEIRKRCRVGVDVKVRQDRKSHSRISRSFRVDGDWHG